MKTNISRTIKHSLLIEGDELGSLIEFIRSKYKEIKITAECKDDSELEANDVSEIINFENPNYRRIKNITIIAHDSYDEMLRLRISSDWYLDAARLSITSQNDETAVYMAQEIPKLLYEMKPGYDIFARYTFSWLLIVAIGIYCIYRVIGLLFGYIKPSPPADINLSGNDIFLLFTTFLLITVGLILSIDRIQKTLFPKVFFLIGKQKKTMDKIVKWRWVLLTTLIFGVVSSLIAEFILRVF